MKNGDSAQEECGEIAAFFDLDGTLIPRPSQERRFFRTLRYQRRIGVRNYFQWFGEAVRLAPRGIHHIAHANKMYLRGTHVDEESCVPGMPVPLFFPQAIERVAWHGQRGHAIVLVSGTLELLAWRAVRALEGLLSRRGLACKIRVCATRLEEMDGKWTGRIVGEAMFGEAKARAVRGFVARESLDPGGCFAYGDSAADRWMLEAVGRPTVVNPSNDLARIARRNGWPVLRWAEERSFTQSAPRTQRTQRTQRRQRTQRARSSESNREGMHVVSSESEFGA